MSSNKVDDFPLRQYLNKHAESLTGLRLDQIRGTAKRDGLDMSVYTDSFLRKRCRMHGIEPARKQRKDAGGTHIKTLDRINRIEGKLASTTARFEQAEIRSYELAATVKDLIKAIDELKTTVMPKSRQLFNGAPYSS